MLFMFSQMIAMQDLTASGGDTAENYFGSTQ